MFISLLLGFLLGAAAIVFALQNTAIVALRFMSWEFESSLALLVVVTLILGMLISVLASIPAAVSTAFRIMGLKKENKRLVTEVENHRRDKEVLIAEGTVPPVLDIRS